MLKSTHRTIPYCLCLNRRDSYPQPVRSTRQRIHGDPPFVTRRRQRFIIRPIGWLATDRLLTNGRISAMLLRVSVSKQRSRISCRHFTRRRKSTGSAWSLWNWNLLRFQCILPQNTLHSGKKIDRVGAGRCQTKCPAFSFKKQGFSVTLSSLHWRKRLTRIIHKGKTHMFA